jgi:pimeloyl-ACP methyl ester carboxylesterase
MSRFTFDSADGTTIAGWRNDGTGTPVVICNGLGTPPIAWPAVSAADSGFRVCSWYYRGTGGSARPADESRISIDDHMADVLALMDHEGLDRALLACWSLGVNIGFELARQHPERVAGVLAVAGVPGGTFQAIGGPLRVPRPLRHRLGVAGAKTAKALGPALSWSFRHTPLNRTTARIISHSGLVTPAARPEWLLPALAEFREHDFRWYFTLALAGSLHEPMDLAFVTEPVTLVAGRHDVITSMEDMRAAAACIPHAELRVLPGSHFLPLEFPTELAAELRSLAGRTEFAPDPVAAG